MQEPGNSRLFYRPRKVPGKFTGASRNTLSVPIKFPGNGPGKLTGPDFRETGPWKESTEFIIPSNIVHKGNKILARINLYSLQ